MRIARLLVVRPVLTLSGLALITLSLASGGPYAAAEESDGLVTRLIDVAALVSGRPEFTREQEPSGGEWTNDEENPLFGAEGEEWRYPLGAIDELIELIQVQIEPRSWETTLGANLAQIDGHILVIRQFSDVADKVQRFVAGLERKIMRVVTVDIQAIRLTSEQVRQVLRPGSDILVDSGKLAEFLTPDALGPGAAVSAYDRHRCAIFAGHQHAFVGDYDVEVAQEAQVSDPIVYVNNLGMSADVRPILASDGSTCLLELNAWLGIVDDVRTVSTGEDRSIEAPSYEIARLVSKVQVPVGSWALIDGEAAVGGSRWLFLVRADAGAEAGGRVARGIALESPVEKPARRFELRSFDIGMLNSVVQPRMAEIPFLMPSNFTPNEPPELPEPMSLLNQEAIVDLLRTSVAPSSWDTLADASIETRNARLYVRNAPDVLDAIAKNLDVLRREFLATVVTTAEVIEVDGALASEIEGAPGRLLTEAGQQQLAAALAAGDATRKGTVRVTNMGGTRNAAVNGRKVTYLSDYEVEIAQGATISNPIIQSCISGALLDIESVRTATEGSVQVILRFMQTRLQEPIRETLTPHGKLELPQLSVFRVRTALRIPIGRTAVVASAGAGGARTVLLLTPRVATGGR